MKNKLFRVMIMFLATAMLCCSSLIYINALQTYSITIQFSLGSHAFSLYKIADIKNNDYILTDDFKDYNIDINDKEIKNLSYILENYVKRDNIQSIKNGTSNIDGILKWDSLDQGLYLIVGESYQYKNKKVTIAPSIIALSNNVNNEYDVNVIPKYTEENIGLVNRKVTKVWKNDNKESRPKSIEVELLKNNEVYETVQLNEKNQWQYRWENLSNEYDWRIVEKNVTSHYTVTSYSENESIFIVNTYNGDKEKEEQDDQIPQTGQLWWPVPVLSIIGMICLIIGIVKKKDCLK